MVDPTMHRMMVRSEIADSDMNCVPALFATYVIRTGDPVQSPAVPLAGVVREGDSTMTV